MRLKGKTAIVTGGAGGIGRSVAIDFVKEGANVVVCDVKKEEGMQLEKELEGALDFITADVSKEDEMKALVDFTIEKYSKIDILVNNAGVQYEETIEHTTVEEWDLVFDINVKGIFLTSKHVIPCMRKQGGGSIINFASIDSFWAEPQLGAYCASKGAVFALTKSTALDFGKDNIRCNAICPGHIDTGMLERFYDIVENADEIREIVTERHPLRRLGTPEDVANMVKFLATDEANYLTGQMFVVDGGLTSGHTNMLPMLSNKAYQR